MQPFKPFFFSSNKFKFKQNKVKQKRKGVTQQSTDFILNRRFKNRNV